MLRRRSSSLPCQSIVTGNGQAPYGVARNTQLAPAKSLSPCCDLKGGVLPPEFIGVCDAHHGAATRRTWRCSTKRGHKLVRSEPAPMALACGDERPSKLDSGGRGVRSLRGCRQGTSQPRYAFGCSCPLAQDGRGRARPRRGHKPRPDCLGDAATPVASAVRAAAYM